ncbi:MAG: hypothetical protein ACETVR_02585 [Candidatus Bathyarchaeia archaeon]
MLRVLGGEHLERRFGRESRRIVEEDFHWEVVAERTSPPIKITVKNPRFTYVSQFMYLSSPKNISI